MRALVIGLLGLVLTACGTPAEPSAPGSGGCAGGTVTITEADNGKTVCVLRDARITVLLHGSADDKWAPVQADGTALTPSAGSPQAGVTGGVYAATRVGTERLTSSRAACPSATPGTMRCGAVLAFTVTVDVR